MILAKKFHQQGHRKRPSLPGTYLQKVMGSSHGVVSGTLTALLVGGNVGGKPNLLNFALMSSYPATTTKLLTSKYLRTSCHQIKQFFTLTARP